MKQSLHIQLELLFGKPCTAERLDLRPDIMMKTDLVTYWKNEQGEAILQEFDGREGYIYQLDLSLTSSIQLPLQVLAIDIHAMYALSTAAPLMLIDPVQQQCYPLADQRARFFYLPARIYHLQVPAARIQLFGFYFQPKLFRDNNERPFKFLHPLIHAHRNRQIQSLCSVDFKVGNTTKNYIEQLLRNVKKGDLDSEKYILDTVITLLQLARTEIYDEYERTSDPEELIRRCRQRIADQIRDSSQPVILKNIAKQLHVSFEHLCRIHKEQHKTTLLAYRDELLLDKIKGLLTSSSYSLSDISERCGFSDSNSLIRFFKKQTGTTPAQYRENLR
ncbi:helix-turn-helix transcriptional regulator [Sphingobacterium paucimobilis]|uniref:HTH araC/xylS-type domain-containing protein n=1 Tax=Sphingobacterium paucimobilis HER1398 TaxID=1346330 RepID=U2IYB9_9SPHI|nr:AraC family transcriptional regulator [Sphingobacterium paucimobilis]ERJ57689.1 hypothetical protein M472_02810 [Sphingobacterium paucimobilis HER1398]